MQVILQFKINPGKGVIDMPLHSKVLSVGVQDGEVYVWAQCDPHAPLVSRTTLSVATGEPFAITHDLRFVGTVHIYGSVYHIYVSV